MPSLEVEGAIIFVSFVACVGSIVLMVLGLFRGKISPQCFDCIPCLAIVYIYKKCCCCCKCSRRLRKKLEADNDSDDSEEEIEEMRKIIRTEEMQKKEKEEKEKRVGGENLEAVEKRLAQIEEENKKRVEEEEKLRKEYAQLLLATGSQAHARIREIDAKLVTLNPSQKEKQEKKA